ncbi:MAG: hypothetical protein ABW212_17385 [Pseudonocardia sediminis]
MSTGRGLVGLVGALTTPTRGGDRPGEVELPVGGGRETFFAYSAEPLPYGQPVLVVHDHGDARVDVVAWFAAPAHPGR